MGYDQDGLYPVESSTPTPAELLEYTLPCIGDENIFPAPASVILEVLLGLPVVAVATVEEDSVDSCEVGSPTVLAAALTGAPCC